METSIEYILVRSHNVSLNNIIFVVVAPNGSPFLKLRIDEFGNIIFDITLF